MNSLALAGTGAFESVLQTSWQAAILVGLILAAQWLFRKQLSPAWRYGLWLLLFVRLLMPALPQSVFSIFNLAAFHLPISPHEHVQELIPHNLGSLPDPGVAEVSGYPSGSFTPRGERDRFLDLSVDSPRDTPWRVCVIYTSQGIDSLGKLFALGDYEVCSEEMEEEVESIATTSSGVAQVRTPSERLIPGTRRFEAARGSRVWIKGSWKVHDWELHGSTIGGSMIVATNFPVLVEQAALYGRTFAQAEVSIPVRDIKSHGTLVSPKIDERVINQLLKSDEHPSIQYRLSELVLNERSERTGAAGVFDSKGELVIAGVTNRISMPVTVAALGEQTLQLTGETSIKLTDFGITPLALNAKDYVVRMADAVNLKFEWVFAEADSP